MRGLATRGRSEPAPADARPEVRVFTKSPRRERRKQHRYCLHPSAAFSVGDGPLVPAHCRDISLGGAFLEASVQPPFGAEVRVHVWVALPEGVERIVVDSVVRWTGAEGFGVQFGFMGARATHALVALFRSASAATALPSRRRYFRASRARLQSYRRRLRAIVGAAGEPRDGRIVVASEAPRAAVG